ncbi:hypothetical protein [Mesorhizobium australicum]|uniref:Uncharacterized protein n=1 Tax=Mesorhizobium australicum TaxID=536018 RepID=A0A1X7P7Y6_9HYPH|nr:hypothetical protein [Mesorhizobium australicum]SMH47100.1 hypothetical protein SAMN02982922_3447 [Mesorhizobium australicum]
MGWRAKAGRQQALKARIVMRLFSIADMAEQAAGRSFWVRWCVLWAAWQANTLLSAYVEGTLRSFARRPWTSVPMPAAFGSHPLDAEELADSLRAFGLYMRAVAAHLCRLSFLHRGQASDEAGNEGGAIHGLGALIERLAIAAAVPVEFCDTS